MKQAMALLQTEVRQQQHPAPYHQNFQPNYPPPQGGHFQPQGGQFQPQFPPRSGRAAFGSQGRGGRGSGNRRGGNHNCQRNCPSPAGPMAVVAITQSSLGIKMQPR
jgi:hypothetical protein